MDINTLTLEQRITRLEDIEAIRYLQAKYQRCLDCRNFDELGKCFTSDAISEYGNGKMSYNGRDEIIHFLCKVMTLDMPSTHLIHGGEIDWIDFNNANALWYLEDQLYHDKYLMQIKGAAIYSVSYVKIDGNWYIKKIGYERCYEVLQHRGLLNLCTLHKRTFFKRVKQANYDELGEYGKYYQKNTLGKKVKSDK